MTTTHPLDAYPAVRIGEHEYYRLHSVGIASGLGSMAKADAERAGLKITSLSMGGREQHYVTVAQARAFVDLCAEQRGDGRFRGFGFNSPPPGMSSAARGRSKPAPAQRQPEESIGGGGTGMPNVLAIAQLAAMQAAIKEIRNTMGMDRLEHLAQYKRIDEGLSRIEQAVASMNGRLNNLLGEVRMEQNGHLLRIEKVLAAFGAELNIKVDD